VIIPKGMEMRHNK